MGTRADELKAELEQQRRSLGYDLEAVGDRVSPPRIVERRRAAARQRLTGIRNRVMGTSDRAWADAAGRAGETARGTAASAREATGGAAHAVRDRAAQAPGAVTAATEGNPLAAGVIAFGAGMLVSGLLPPSRPERQMAERIEPALTGAREEATAVAREAAEHLRPEAEDAATRVRDRAAGGAETVTGEARRAADDVRQEATQATDDVRQEATRAAGDVRQEATRAAGDVRQEAVRAKDDVRDAARDGGSGG